MGSRLLPLLPLPACLALACELPLPNEPDPAPPASFATPDAAPPPPDAFVPAAATLTARPALTWLERSSIVVLNGARAAPRQFRDRYMDFGDASSPNVFDGDPPSRPPLRYSTALAEAARFHADDRMPCFGGGVNAHALCDGTPFWDWVDDWGPPTITAGVAHPWLRPIDRRLPLWFTSSFICDGLLRSDGKVFECVSDGAEAAGHRRILVLAASETQIGAGYATGADFGFYSGETSRDPVGSSSPLVTAGHFFDGDRIVFAANVEAAAAPRSVTLVVGGTRRALPVDLGTATRGMYAHAESAANACRSYYFELVDAAGTTWRAPTSGAYATSGEGACDQDWLP